jgi:peptidoglycan/xylan/chitin deacetylase (PgdA/CDA1 family)
MVCEREVPHVDGLYTFRSVRQFKADMQFFLLSYTPVSLQDVICHLDGGRRLPGRCFLPTFDDGFREIHDVVAPILRARGIPAVFFLTTSVIDNRELCRSAKESLLIRALALLEDSPARRKVSQLLADAGVKGSDLSSRIRQVAYHQRSLLDELALLLGCDFAAYSTSVKPYMTTAQIRDLIGGGFAIGAHSVDHPRYSGLSLEEQLAQTRASVDWLSKHFQYECQAFAFPYNDTGVSLEFFQRAFADGGLKVSFGTGGVCHHYFPRNLERFTMENTDSDAELILAREFGVNAFRRIWRAGQTGDGVSSSERQEDAPATFSTVSHE